jgi:hypothetical protein
MRCARCAKIQYRTRTRVTRFGNTAGIPVPVRNPNQKSAETKQPLTVQMGIFGQNGNLHAMDNGFGDIICASDTTKVSLEGSGGSQAVSIVVHLL